MSQSYPREPVAVSPSVVLAELRARSSKNRRTRDPRAARLEIHKNVSIVETCRFYGVADALSSCRVPRSCQDCLRMPGCAIGYDGRCENASVDYVQRYEYSAALANANPHGTAYNRTLRTNDPTYTFFSANATYCEASDEICGACSAKFRSLARSKSTVNTIGNQFCVGANGCVCVAVCEVPELHALRTRDMECYGADYTSTPAIPTLDLPTLPSFSSRRRDPRSLPTVPAAVRHANGSCAYYEEQDIRGCHAPRSCRDCLDREGCMISGFTCVDAATYDPASDFRVREGAFKSAQYSLFPSSNTTYCPPEDAKCASCRAMFEAKRVTAIGVSGYINLADYQRNGTFCVGAGGCVCIELCENTAFFLENVKDTDCLHTEIRALNGDHFFVLGAVAIFLVMVQWGVLWLDGRPPRPPQPPQAQRQTALQLWRHMLDQAPQVLQLDLFGWRRYHRELEEKELELLNGAQDVSPVARPMGFDCTDPTAPDFDEDDSSAPVATNPTALASAPVYRLSE